MQKNLDSLSRTMYDVHGGRMISDRRLLIFIHERLVKVHKESELTDYMHRLRDIIIETPPDKKSKSHTCNGICDLIEILEKKNDIS